MHPSLHYTSSTGGRFSGCIGSLGSRYSCTLNPTALDDRGAFGGRFMGGRTPRLENRTRDVSYDVIIVYWLRNIYMEWEVGLGNFTKDLSLPIQIRWIQPLSFIHFLVLNRPNHQLKNRGRDKNCRHFPDDIFKCILLYLSQIFKGIYSTM